MELDNEKWLGRFAALNGGYRIVKETFCIFNSWLFYSKNHFKSPTAKRYKCLLSPIALLAKKLF